MLVFSYPINCSNRASRCIRVVVKVIIVQLKVFSFHAVVETYEFYVDRHVNRGGKVLCTKILGADLFASVPDYQLKIF